MGLALHAFLYLYDKKTTKACLCVILAYFFHKSSLIFLFGLLLYFVRNKKFYYYFIGTFLLLCLLSADRIVVLMLDILHDDHFTNYYEETGVYSWVAFFYYLVLLLASMSFRKLYDKYNREESRIMFGFAIIALALQSLSSVVPSAFRLATFYVPFFIILLPNSFSIGSKTGQQYKIFILLLMLLFYFYTNRNGGNIVPYKFFWQDYNITYQKFGG